MRDLVAEVWDIAAGRFEAATATTEERLGLIEQLCTKDHDLRQERAARRAAHVRGFMISLVLVLQGLTDLHMWARV